MGKFSKIHHYISKEDLKRVHEQKVRAKKLESERIEEEKEEIKAEFEQLKSDWRNELRESDFTNITKGNKVGQTFQHTSGATITLDGALGGKMMVPSQVTLDLGFGEKITVDGPTESDFALTGFTKPLDLKVMQRQNVKTAKEINDQLDASKKVSDVDTAEVDVSEGDIWTWVEYNNQMNALSDKYAKMAEPFEKVKLDYIYNKNEPVPIGIVDKIDAITKALHQAQEALHQKWLAYNKVPDLPDGGDKSSFLDNIASKMKVGTAKNVFDLHLNYLKNPTGKVQNINNLISKKDINALSKTITNNATIDQLKFDTGALYGVLQNTINRNSGLRNSLGNLDQSKIYLNDSQTEVVIEKPYDFSGLKDLQGAGDVKTKVGAPAYAALNVLQGKMSVKDLIKGTDTMVIRVNIPIKKKKLDESTAFSKIKKIRNK